MIFTVLEQHKLLFKRWLLSNKNQLECQGRSALLSIQFTLDKTADFLLFESSRYVAKLARACPKFRPILLRKLYILILYIRVSYSSSGWLLKY